MSKRSGPNKENLEETRRVFLEMALEEFCEYGYPAASTSRIVENSGMARGSLYYHFGDKYGLFEAVYELMCIDAANKLSEKMDLEDDPWDALMVGSEVFLDLCMNDNFRKIVLFEGQAAMPYGERLVILGRTILLKLFGILPDILASGSFPGHTFETASVFISGYLAEIGRSLDFSEDLKETRDAHWRAYEVTMNQLRHN